MSFYNLMHGVYPATDILLGMLDLSPHGKWPVGRFRDIYPMKTEDGKLRIVLFTRNGGGNRDCWSEVFGEDGKKIDLGKYGKFKCSCPGCTIEKILPKHPFYDGDWDDEFDYTYAYIRFKVPEQFQEEVEMLLNIGGTRNPTKMFKDILNKLRSGDSEDPEVKAAVKRLKPLIKQITEAMNDNKGDGFDIIEV